mmetsp:Transcript_69519/g.163373  ORF Transcript_69519/g.163373 Transcript_69519/m.163373 type:complete len:208 (-) Transcript_69519:390-1013(-)
MALRVPKDHQDHEDPPALLVTMDSLALRGGVVRGDPAHLALVAVVDLRAPTGNLVLVAAGVVLEARVLGDLRAAVGRKGQLGRMANADGAVVAAYLVFPDPVVGASGESRDQRAHEGGGVVAGLLVSVVGALVDVRDMPVTMLLLPLSRRRKRRRRKMTMMKSSLTTPASRRTLGTHLEDRVSVSTVFPGLSSRHHPSPQTGTAAWR